MIWGTGCIVKWSWPELIDYSEEPSATIIVSGLKKPCTLLWYGLSCCTVLGYGDHILNSIERVQRRATKFILNDYKSDYKSRLNSLKSPSKTFDTSEYIKFSTHKTRSSSCSRMVHQFMYCFKLCQTWILQSYTKTVELYPDDWYGSVNSHDKT